MIGKNARFLWLALAALVLLAIVAVVGVSVWVQRFLRSEDFQRLVAARTGEALQADASVGALRWNGSSVFSDSFQADGRAGGVLQRLRADQVRAEVNWRAVLQGAWRVDQIDVVKMEGTFRPGTPAAAPVPPRDPAPQLPGWLPRRFELGQLNVSQASFTFGGVQGSETIRLQDTGLVLKPEGSSWGIDGRRGTLSVPGLPTLEVSDFRSRLQGGTFYLTEARLRYGEAGTVTASGEFAQNSQLQVDWAKVDVAAFLDEAWKDRLSGQMAGKATIKWPVAGIAAGQASGTFRLTDGLLQNLHLLEKIASFTGAPQFRRMPVQEFSGTFQWAVGALALNDVVLESKGLLRLEGQCTVGSAGELAGRFRVGVTPQTLQWLPGSRERVFIQAENGYLWTEVKIGGTVEQVQEDLSPRLARAMGEEVIDQGSSLIENLPGAARDGAKGVLDALSPLLR